MTTDRFYSSAQSIIGLAIGVLPLGAGVSVYITQQDTSLPTFLLTGVLWSGLLIIVASVIASLRVIRTPEPMTPGDRPILAKKYQLAVTLFTIGVLLIALAIGGFATKKLISPEEISLKLSSESVEFDSKISILTEAQIFLIADNVNVKSYPSLHIETIISDSKCLTVTKIGDQPPVYSNDTWISIWKISKQPACCCLNGDYNVTFKIWKWTELVSQVTLTIRFMP